MEERETQEQEKVLIRTRVDGPLVVEGPVRLTDADGNEYDITGKARLALCRCGGSTRKPFCDGTHSKIGFAAAERAVREAEGEGEGKESR